MPITRRVRRDKKTVNKRMKQRIGKKSKAIRRRKHRQTRYRSMLGGSVSGAISDTNTFATHYIVKSANENNPNIGTLNNPASFIQENFKYESIPQGSVLWVIDMQNDFLDLMDGDIFGDDGRKLTGPPGPNGNIGAFAVTDGKQIINEIKGFIENYGAKFKKIIFTRDFHPPDHCSFGSSSGEFSPVSGYDGKFPPHCVYDTPGADITPAIKEMIQYNTEKNMFRIEGLPDTVEVEILFKGHHSEGDSFAAVPYTNLDYLNTRQNQNREPSDFKNPTASCCQGAACNGKTGGVKLNADHYKDSLEQNVFNGQKDPKSLLENTYDIESTRPNNGGEVYVIGLAGEFCVKDTAMNLKRYFDEDVKVNVIQDLTRYVFVPIYLSFQRYDDKGNLIPFGEWKNPQNETRLNKNVFIDEVYNDHFKPLSLYLFTYGGVNPSQTKRLTIEEMKDINENTDISFPVNPLDPEDPKKGLKYWHFTMNQNQLIRDYVNTGITLCISESIDKILYNSNTDNNIASVPSEPSVPNEDM